LLLVFKEYFINISLLVGACVATASPGEDMLVVLFEVDVEQLEGFYEREHRLNIIEAVVEELHPPLTTGETKRALLCTDFKNDEEYIQCKCAGEEDYQRRVGDFYKGRLWREDILPVRKYLSLCLSAAKAQSEAFCDNFLDHSYLADRKTTIRRFLFEVDTAFLVIKDDGFYLPEQETQRIEQWRKENVITSQDNYV